jgi:hypothetical protein
VPPLNIYNSTIAFNTSSVWSFSGTYFAAGVHILSQGNLNSTIIANNVNSSAPTPTADLSGLSGTFFAGDHNNVMNPIISVGGSTDGDPGLHPLQDNGGPTRTHIPTPGPWDTFHGSNALGEFWDQRGFGFPRAPALNQVEIGAFQTNSDFVFTNGFN